MKKAQTILEMAAALTILCLILYGMVAVFRWGMIDMAEQRYDHDTVLISTTGGIDAQVNPNFHQVRPLDGILRKK